jgi:two-component system chemotaxis sensor kinase CheA
VSVEADLLTWIDSLIVETLAFSPEEGIPGGARMATLAGLCASIAPTAHSLGMAETAACAERLGSQIASPGPDFVAFLEQQIELLQLNADGELAARLSQQRVAAGGPAEIFQDRSMIGDFIGEAREHLEMIEQELLLLEQSPQNPEPIHAIFRSFHTIKGLAGIFNLTSTRDLAHEVETLLDLVRNGALPATPSLVDVVLACADRLGEIVNLLAEDLGDEGVPLPDNTALLERLRNQMMPPDDDPVLEAAGVPVAAGNVMPVAAGNVLPAAVLPESDNVLPVAAESDPAAARRRASDSSSAQVKVDTSKLDFLVDMVGELVIAQSLVQQDPSVVQFGDPRLGRNLAQLGRITTDLQKTAMSLRVVPIRQTFQRMQRAFRDLVKKSGKQAELELIGEDAELDRSIVEQLADPLMHMIRNSVDHGLEAPGEREQTGKPSTGKVRLAASHQSGNVLIEISDDGRGLNRTKILKKAIERGLIPADANLPVDKILELIFEPGFSTADQISDVSGRGVGMDVVKKQIQKLRGRIEIRSEPGIGTTFLLRFPLTLAIIDGLTIRVSGERYILPLHCVQEIFRPEADSIYRVKGTQEVVLIRDRVIPLLRLYQLLGRTPERTDPYSGILISIELEGRRYCLLVDELLGKQEVVIKNLGEYFSAIPGVSGGAILGDGCVGLILDLEGLLSKESFDAAA